MFHFVEKTSILCHYIEGKNFVKECYDMAKLSIEKMQELRNELGYTYKDIAQKTGLSESSITKLFGGFQVNPSVDSVIKIAEAFNCGMDDFFDWDEEPVSPYYLDRETAAIADLLKEQPDLKVLLDASRSLTPNDIKFVIDFVNKIKGNKNG